MSSHRSHNKRGPSDEPHRDTVVYRPADSSNYVKGTQWGKSDDYAWRYQKLVVVPPIPPGEDFGHREYENRQRPVAIPDRPVREFNATEAHARKAGLPRGLDLTGWDPTNEPIRVLQRVFDVFSLGEWIFNGAVVAYEECSPQAYMAQELWSYLTSLYDKTRRAREIVSGIRSRHNQGTLDHFMGEAEEFKVELRGLLDICEARIHQRCQSKPPERTLEISLWVARTLLGNDNPSQQGKNTNKFIEKIWVWCHDFDLACLQMNNKIGEELYRT